MTRQFDDTLLVQWLRQQIQAPGLPKDQALGMSTIANSIGDVMEHFQSIVKQEMLESLRFAMYDGPGCTGGAVEINVNKFNRMLSEHGFGLRDSNGRDLVLVVDHDRSRTMDDFCVSLADAQTKRVIYAHPIDPEIFSKGGLHIDRTPEPSILR